MDTSRNADPSNAAREASERALFFAVSHLQVKPLLGLPDDFEVPGRGRVKFGPLQEAHELAYTYMESVNLPYKPIKTYAKVDPVRAWHIACSYEQMIHAPDDPLVRKVYDAMITETIAQYQFVKKAGITIELITNPENDPYRASPRLTIIDVVDNKHLWMLLTKASFGSNQGLKDEVNNILFTTKTEETIGGEQLCANDIFRIVHDYFGHIKDGIGFRADGEENAWRSHAAMYSRSAVAAITPELRGQNSWLNFGPCGEQNRTAKAVNTTYADQKNGLLPEWVWDEGREDPIDATQ